MIRTCAALFALFAFLGTTGAAQTLQFPSNASLQIETLSAVDSYEIAVGPWADGRMPVEKVEGELTQQAWRIEAAALTTLQLLRPLREQLRNARFTVLFECQTEACGGFDFRFSAKTLSPPEMRISLGDFRYLAARREGEDGPEYISLFVSRTSQSGFVQVTRIGPAAQETAIASTSAPALRAATTQLSTDVAISLDAIGHAVLSDLTFQTGSSQLGEGPFVSLQMLADYLVEFPDRKVALVGHTDSSGSLDANIALSKRRAGSVLQRLVSDYGVNRRQLEAQGMGYLSPIANNLTEEGREANRRVEVIITSTDDR